MKYENSKVKGIRKKTLRTLEQIALSASYALELRGGIEARNNDSEDFQDISVIAIQEMLEPTGSVSCYRGLPYGRSFFKPKGRRRWQWQSEN